MPWKRRGLSQRAHCVRGGKEQHDVNLIRHRNLRPGVRDRVEADAVPLA
ncbi:hypothetical protein MNNICLKF_01217 [Synechococcus sp. CBW1107]|nr:hypothetical protein MNNICLKF_01217 [Synechococcus sp. CBW1107]